MKAALLLVMAVLGGLHAADKRAVRFVYAGS